MAKQVVTVITDDIDGTEGAETITFSLSGKDYEVDLSQAHAAKLFETLAPFMAAGRQIGSKSKKGKGKKAGVGAKIRKWAAENGFTVSSRGRIPAEVRAAYNHANPL